MSAEPTDDGPDSPRGALIAALAVRRYAKLAAGFAAAFALGVALFFVGVVGGGRTAWPIAYYPALAFVVFVTTAMLALAVLVGRRVLALAVHPASIVRAGATGGLLAGVAWFAAAVALPLGPAAPWAIVVDVALPWAALLTPLGLWAVHTRFKRTVALRPVAAGATLAALAGALVLADLAAVDLTALLPGVGRPVDPGTARLYRAGAVALVGGQTTVAVLALLGDGHERGIGHARDRWLPAVLSIPSMVGLAGLFVLGVGRPGLGTLAAGLGVCWLLAGWRLRGVDDDAVPAAPGADLPQS